jgi:NADH-quinone oxidoreductase subunit G
LLPKIEGLKAMVKAIFNGMEICVTSGTTILKACFDHQIEIPHFCYHKELSVAGNCRMCLVEVDKIPKPVASCATQIVENMKISTNTEKVKLFQESVMEFLLVNHPLDCSVCDEAGECDLQDLSYKYGKGHSRFSFPRRLVAPKDMGPFISTIMTRCIHCTRCIRFANEIQGVPLLGAINRSETMEIASIFDMVNISDGSMFSTQSHDMVENTIQNISRFELSGNLIDICPVGAINNAPYALTARSFELTRTKTIDCMDGFCSKIEVHHKDDKIFRIWPLSYVAQLRFSKKPLYKKDLWIHDKTRFSYDGHYYQRLDKPLVRKNGKLDFISWDDAFDLVCFYLQQTDPRKIAAVSGDLTDQETLRQLKNLLDALQCFNYDCRFCGSDIPIAKREDYLFNTTFEKADQVDSLLLIGTHLRDEAPTLNSRFFQNFSKRQSYSAGVLLAQGNRLNRKLDLTYPFENLGDSMRDLESLSETPFYQKFKESENPCLIVGSFAFRFNINPLLQFIKKDVTRENYNGYNVLHHNASIVGGLDIGFFQKDHPLRFIKKIEKGDFKIVFLFNVDTLKINKDNTFVIYIGHHGDLGAEQADLILPGSTFFEKSATFVNTEGVSQKTESILSKKGLFDAEIVQIISDKLSIKNFTVPTHCERTGGFEEIIQDDNFLNEKITPYFDNFFMTNVISKNSPLMAKASKWR